MAERNSVMENMEKILKKIKNLLDLANNNPNEHEAMAAALKAQELMAKYNVDSSAIDSDKSEKEMHKAIYSNTGKHEMKKWKIGLAQIIARNFCCKVYFMDHGGKDVVFYGYKKDATIAVEVFRFLYDTGNKLAVRYYNKCKKEGRSTKGLMNTYLDGFCTGIKDVLDKQCTALMIVVPKEVEESYTEMAKGFGTFRNTISLSNDRRAYDDGRRDGKDTATARGIEG